LYLAKEHKHHRRIFHALAEAGKGLSHVENDCLLCIFFAEMLIAVGHFKPAEHFLQRAEKNFITGQEQMLATTISQFRFRMKQAIEKGLVRK